MPQNELTIAYSGFMIDCRLYDLLLLKVDNHYGVRLKHLLFHWSFSRLKFLLEGENFNLSIKLCNFYGNDSTDQIKDFSIQWKLIYHAINFWQHLQPPAPFHSLITLTVLHFAIVWKLKINEMICWPPPFLYLNNLWSTKEALILMFLVWSWWPSHVKYHVMY
jgi:hypothetical protein